MAFTPAALQADAPTTAFTPVKPDAPAPAAAPQPAPPKMAAQPGPRPCRAYGKGKDIGAAVFSALVADDDVPPAPAVPPASGGR
ncbi:MAG: hypothetical protein ACLRZH_14495 [Ruthenibacterium lactatiformans]